MGKIALMILISESKTHKELDEQIIFFDYSLSRERREAEMEVKVVGKNR